MTRAETVEGKPPQLVHQFFVIAPQLANYRRGLFSVEHESPGAYPASVISWYLLPKGRDPEDYEFEPPRMVCDTQEEFLNAVRKILQSREVASLLESLIAQINDASDPDADA